MPCPKNLDEAGWLPRTLIKTILTTTTSSWRSWACSTLGSTCLQLACTSTKNSSPLHLLAASPTVQLSTWPPPFLQPRCNNRLKIIVPDEVKSPLHLIQQQSPSSSVSFANLSEDCRKSFIHLHICYLALHGGDHELVQLWHHLLPHRLFLQVQKIHHQMTQNHHPWSGTSVDILYQLYQFSASFASLSEDRQINLTFLSEIDLQFFARPPHKLSLIPIDDRPAASQVKEKFLALSWRWVRVRMGCVFPFHPWILQMQMTSGRQSK